MMKIVALDHKILAVEIIHMNAILVLIAQMQIAILVPQIQIIVILAEALEIHAVILTILAVILPIFVVIQQTHAVAPLTHAVVLLTHVAPITTHVAQIQVIQRVIVIYTTQDVANVQLVADVLVGQITIVILLGALKTQHYAKTLIGPVYKIINKITEILCVK